MKAKWVLSVVFVVIFSKVSLSHKNDTLFASISFTRTNIDTTTIKAGTPSFFKYQFQNTGNSPLVLRYVSSLCDCITPSWTKEKIMPGEWGYIDCVYTSAGNLGNFSKQVIVYSNAKNGNINLGLKGYIIN